MSNPPLYGSMVPLDRNQHKKLKLRTDIAVAPHAAQQNSMFLTVAEFAEACKEYPIVFVRVGEPPKEGAKPTVAPVAALGLKQGTNLFVDGDQWTGNYVPAYLRRYPFAMARMEPGSDQVAVCFDANWAGFNETEGQQLIKEDGTPTEFLDGARQFLENFEQEAERTRLICERLVQEDLLTDMRFEASFGEGDKLEVDGFLAIDEKKFAELPDAKVVELFRLGLIAVIEMHRLSLGNMQRLAARHGAAQKSA